MENLPDQDEIKETLRRLAARVHAGWLKIHAKKLEGADTDLCLREAYDLMAATLTAFDQEPDDFTLRVVIPDWILHWARVREWLPSDYARAGMVKRLGGRIAYWQSEALVLKQNAIPLRERLEAIETVKELTGGPRKQIREDFVRGVLAQQFGIKPEEVTWEQIWSELELLGDDYCAIEIVPSDPETVTEDQKLIGCALPRGVWRAFAEYLQQRAEQCPDEDSILTGASQLARPNPPKDLRKYSQSERFPNRAKWLQQRLIERAWDHNDPPRHNGPDRKTVDKILRGEGVREDVLEKLAKALSRKFGKIDLLEIPRS